MTTFVVDTNVVMVADGQATHVDKDCQQECVKKLTSLVAEGVIAIDKDGLIMAEYKKGLKRKSERQKRKGEKDVFVLFIRHLFDNRHQDKRVREVKVTPVEDGRGFAELPENKFHDDDRKFLAVAIAAGAVVLNAADSDWGDHAALMDTLGVEVKQLCPQHSRRGPRQ